MKDLEEYKTDFISRESVVNISRKLIDSNNTLSILEIVDLLQSYCKEKCIQQGKDWEDVRNIVDSCISNVISNGTWQVYFNKALTYYKIKYTIYELYSQEFETKNLLGQVIKTRKLLQIY